MTKPETAAITAWMRRRAGDRPDGPGMEEAYARGWYDALTDIADEIEANEREGCGHASDER